MTTKDPFAASLEDALHKAFEAATYEDNLTIADSLRELLRQVLEAKIRHFVQTQNYSAALQRAAWLLETHRTSPSSLLNYGEIVVYAGHTEKAIRIYEHGASLFPAESAFGDRIAQLRQGLAKRRDPVRCLPPEIITRIFEYAPQQRLTSRGVSHTWRNALDHLPIWRHVKIRRDGSNLLSQCNSRQLTLLGLGPSPEEVPMLGHQLQHLTWSTFYPSKYIIEALATNECIQLQSLDLVLKNSPVRDTFSELCRFPARAFMASHLTELTLDVHYGHRYSLLRLLASLPQLASLKYTHRSHDGSTDEEVLFSGPAIPTGPHRLQHLQCLCTSWSDRELQHLPAMLPELESLVIEQVKDYATQDMLGAFMQQSKKLKTLVWAYDVGPLLDTLPSTFSHLSINTTTTNTKPHQSGPPSGTRHVILGQNIQVPSADIQGFLQRNQHTLEALQFEGRELGLFGQTLVFQQLSFFQLRHLSLYSCFAPVTDSLPGLLSSCPNLEELSLFYVDLLLDDDALAIAELRRLHTLTIENCYYDCEFLPGLFRQIVTLGCPVTDVTVIDDVSEEIIITEIMLAQLGDIASLKKVVLDAQCDAITSDHIETFLEHAQHSGLVQSLQYLDLFRSAIAMEPQWLVLLHSAFPAAHIIPGFIFPKVFGDDVV